MGSSGYCRNRGIAMLSFKGEIVMRILSKRQLKELVLYSPQHIARLDARQQVFDYRHWRAFRIDRSWTDCSQSAFGWRNEKSCHSVSDSTPAVGWFGRASHNRSFDKLAAGPPFLTGDFGTMQSCEKYQKTSSTQGIAILILRSQSRWSFLCGDRCSGGPHYL